MKKEDVELIVFKVCADDQDAISMKIYKNGTVCRTGAGGLPPVDIGLMAFVEDSRYFDPLLAAVPPQALEQPINIEEPQTPNGYLEYVLAFYGKSRNGDTGERADWGEQTGIRVRLDRHSTFNHPIMGMLDGLTLDAAELTNEIYFDAVLAAKSDAKSSTLGQAIITQPKTRRETDKAYQLYVDQMLGSVRKWDMGEYIKNKTYYFGDAVTVAKVRQDQDGFGIEFEPVETGSAQAAQTDGSRWRPTR